MSKLGIFDSSYLGGAVIAWVCDDGEMGTVIGEGGGDHETEIAESAIRRSGIDYMDTKSYRGFVFASEREARRALRVARAAVKAVKAGAVWPEWATTALANGWTPPKGWSP